MENILNKPVVSYANRYTQENYLNKEWINGQSNEYWDCKLIAN
jgi:hypothetical protein